MAFIALFRADSARLRRPRPQCGDECPNSTPSSEERVSFAIFSFFSEKFTAPGGKEAKSGPAKGPGATADLAPAAPCG